MILQLRKYRQGDLQMLAALFRETVYAVAKNDYSRRQLEVWASAADDPLRFGRRFSEHLTYVAECDGQIVGFADMTRDGYIDHVFTHKDFQNKGIGSALMGKLISEARGCGLEEITLESSKTGRRFYEGLGFKNRGELVRNREDAWFVNYDMAKKL